MWGRLAACGGVALRPAFVPMRLRRLQIGAQAASPPHHICGQYVFRLLS
jgi:hypothetical protein